MDDSDYEDVRESILIEGLVDALNVGNIPTSFLFDNHRPKRPVSEAQQLTLRMIRDLVSEGLFVLGVPWHGSFNAWDIPLGAAVAQIEGGRGVVGPNQEGKELALQLYYADEPDEADAQTPGGPEG